MITGDSKGAKFEGYLEDLINDYISITYSFLTFLEQKQDLTTEEASEHLTEIFSLAVALKKLNLGKEMAIDLAELERQVNNGQ